MSQLPFTNFDLPTIEHGDFQLIEIKEGWLKDRKILNVPHRHTFHEILWITEGVDTHKVDFEEYKLGSNHALFIPQNSMHDYQPGKNTKGWKLIFNENFFLPNQYNIIKDSLLFIPCLGKKEFDLNKEIEIFSSSINLLRNLTNIKQKQALVANLLIYLEDLYLNNVNTSNTLFIHFLKLLGKSIYYEKSVKFYADKLGVNSKSLNKIVKEATGTTTSDYISSRILLEAKSKLKNPNIYIKNIADSLGYDDALYFSRFFKKHCGLSPEKYRAKYN